VNLVDYSILALIGVSVIAGVFRGLVREALSLSVWILAVWLATVFSPKFESYFSSMISSSSIRLAVAFLLIALAVLILGSIINMIIGMLISKSGLGFIDKFLGFVFGFARGVLIVALIFLVINIVELPNNTVFNQSKLAPQFKPLVTWLAQYVPDFSSQIDKLQQKQSVAVEQQLKKSTIEKLASD
jgi:membrane protein required for colicin V production